MKLTLQRTHLFLTLGLLLITSTVFGQLSGTKTIGTGGTYSNLTNAFIAASSAGINGPVLFELLSTYNSSGETYPITIGLISGSSSVNTITIRPATGATGLSINTNNATATIDLNGATNVIIDGRPGGTGTRNLVINNSSATGVAIRWNNDACFNTVRHAILSGQNTATTGGVIFFGGTTGSRGNDSNTVDNCDIKDDGGNTPTTSVYGAGSTTGVAYYNSNNYITNNNIINFWNNASSEVNAFKVSAGNTDWIITGNSMYQTSTRVPTSAFQLYFFNMNNTGANNHVMDNNWCGGSAPQCGGSPFTVNATIGFRITGCYLNVGATTPSSFSGNTFANFDITSGTSVYSGIPGVFGGPWLVGGLLNVNNNTFGSMTGTSSIKITSSVSGSAVFPIGATGTTAGTINIKGNKFGGIEVAGSSPSISTSLQCISIASSGSSVYYNIDSNVIGNTLVDNLICSTPSNNSTAQIAMGIYNASALCNINARNNIVRNIRNNAVGSASGINYFTHGIDIGGGGVDTITGNQVYNLTNAALYQNNNTGSAAIIGIRLTPTSSGNVFSQNTIYGLNSINNSTAVVSVIGMIANSMSNSRVDRNFVHSLNAQASGTSASIYGIQYGGGTSRLFNNMVRLGVDSAGNSITLTPSIIGIQKISGNLSLINNSVYIGGTNVGSGLANTYAFQSIALGTDSVMNNHLTNERSNASSGGSHIAVNLSASTGMIEDYNNLYANGTGGVTAMLGTTPYSGISAWNSASGIDANSMSASAGFKTPNGSNKTVDLHITSNIAKGNSSVSVNGDFDGDVRNVPADLGADEIPYDVGVFAIDSPTSSTFCGQPKNIYARIKNYSSILSISSVWININVNGNVITNYFWSGTLLPGSTSPVFNLGPINFASGAYTLALNTYLPNSKIDNNTSNDTAKVSFTAIPSSPTAVNISTNNTTVCINTPVTFKATFNNSGPGPVFTWLKNGVSTGITDTVYTTSGLNNKDTIVLQMASNATCATPAVAKSNPLIMTVGVTLPPSVTITSTTTTVCPGTPISYTATATNGGTKPAYQWLRNLTPVGTDSSRYTLATPAHGDSVKCIMTSNLSCASKLKDTSIAIKANVLVAPVPTAVITSGATTICANVVDTFKATITNGGSNPTYSWRKNNNIQIGTNFPVLNSNGLVNGDSIYLVLTSNAQCANPTTVTSNKIGLTVTPTVTPTVTVIADKTNICNGDSIKFKALFTNGGTAPVKQWYRNSTLLYTGIDSFTTAQLTNNDSIYVVFTSNANCATINKVTSVKQVVTVNNVVTPSVGIAASKTSICSGTPVTFTATALNGGSSPHFTWRKNGVILGNDSSGFTTTSINNNDSIYVTLTSNATCATKTLDSSNKIKMSVTQTVTPSVTISTNSTSFCSGTPVFFNSTSLNGGITPHYSWYRNSVKVGSDSMALTLINAADHDTIQLQLNSSNTCVSTNDVKSNKLILFKINSVTPTVTIGESVNNICKGTTVTFIATSTNSGTSPTYNWMINNVSKGNNTSLFVTDSLNDKDTISLRMTSSATCASPLAVISNKIGMSVTPLLTPSISITSNPSSICNGGIVTFTATSVHGGTKPVLRWLLNGFTAGSDSANFTTTMLNSYTVKCVLTSNATCVSRLRDTALAVVEVKPIPPKPIVTRSDDTLYSTQSGSYQWSLNNTEINGSINRFHVAKQNGNYRVVIDSNGCKNSSDVFIVANVGIDPLNQQKVNIKVWPNPTDNTLWIDALFNSETVTEIRIHDMTGRTIQHITIPSTKILQQYEIDIRELKAGAYMMHIKHGEEEHLVKTIINK